MKKIVFTAAIAVLALTSCKKDRTCTCTSTPVSNTTNGVAATNLGTPTTEVTKYTKVSKKGVDCSSGEETMTTTGSFGGISYTNVSVDKVECTLD